MKVVDFLLEIGKLKKLKRTGWIRNNIPNPESVAEHSFRGSVLTAIFAKKLGLDELRAIKMSLFHDIAESEIGDIVTQDGKVTLYNLKEKLQKERDAFIKLLNLINEEEQIELFDEFEENKTPEARLVKEIDKLEMAIQAYEYEKEHKINLETFFESSRHLISSKEIKTVLEEIEGLRS